MLTDDLGLVYNSETVVSISSEVIRSDNRDSMDVLDTFSYLDMSTIGLYFATLTMCVVLSHVIRIQLGHRSNHGNLLVTATRVIFKQNIRFSNLISDKSILIALLFGTLFFELTIESCRSTDLTTRPRYRFISSILDLNSSNLVPIFMENEKVTIEFAHSRDPLKHQIWRRAKVYKGSNIFEAVNVIMTSEGALILFDQAQSMVEKLYLIAAIENWWYNSPIQTIANGRLYSRKRAPLEVVKRLQTITNAMREFQLDHKLRQRRAEVLFPDPVPVAMSRHGLDGNSRVKQVKTLIHANFKLFFRSIVTCWTLSMVIVLVEILRHRRKRQLRRQNRRKRRMATKDHQLIITGIVKRVPVYVTVYSR